MKKTLFLKKGFLRGAHNFAKGGHKNFFCAPPPPTQMLLYAPGLSLIHSSIFISRALFLFYTVN